jgi:signal transduction histidine kinase/ActR/RegA family two-component response regulator
VANADAKREETARLIMHYAPKRDGQHPIRQTLEIKKSQLLPQVPDSVLKVSARDETHFQALRALEIQSCMLVPLLAEGQTLGVMTLVSCSTDRHYDSLDLSLAEDLARRCAMAIENARLHQKTLDALRARDEFLAVLSHELRSPLTSILGWTQLLQEGGLDSEMQSHAMGVIERNTKTQVQLIEDLLEVSRIITGQLRLESKPVSVSKVIKNVLDLIEPTAKAKNIGIQFVNQSQSDTISGDEARLQQIFWNLVSNALKFTPPTGNVNLLLMNEGDFVKIVVQDSGEGIDVAFLPYVFDRFRQANSSSTRHHGGLGLGLAIVRHLSEMHAGTVSVHSSGKGQGATFTVKLPLRLSFAQVSDNQFQHLNDGEQEKTRIAENPSLQGLRILLVEDGDDARELIGAILRREGATVKAVNSASDAMNALNTDIPDVLISDIGMPGEDGYSLMCRIKEWEDTHGKSIPAIALTAYASERDRRLALAAGFQTHLTKPVEPALLVATVATLGSQVDAL